MFDSVKGVVSAGDPLTSEAGAEILKAGGNAYDAAIAATFTSFVASSTISSQVSSSVGVICCESSQFWQKVQPRLQP